MILKKCLGTRLAMTRQKRNKMNAASVKKKKIPWIVFDCKSRKRVILTVYLF